jgi:hypothetical protein
MKVSKKQILKRGVAVLLAVLLAATMFSLASCGEKAKDAVGKDAPVASGQGVENPGSDIPVPTAPEPGEANSPSGAGAYSAGDTDVDSDDAAAPTEPVMGDIVYFGRYPQSLCDQEHPTTAPSTGTEGVDWVKLKVGYFGRGSTCGNPPKNSIAYYKMEPIAWRVLGNSGGKLFLMSEKLIDAGQIHHDRYFTWETADMRRWLARTFVGHDTGYPLTEGESGAIAATTVGGVGLGNATVDRVFLLSEAEAKSTALGFVSNTARIGFSTQYANAHYMYADNQWRGNWWTRTRCNIADRNNEAFVRNDGAAITANTGQVITELEYAIRPALNLDISAVILSLVSGDGLDDRTTWTATVPDTPTHTEHVWGDWTVTVEPTPTSEGMEERTCPYCGAKEERTLPKLPHDHDWGEWTVVVQPTPTSEGREERTCPICGEVESQAIAKLPPPDKPGSIASAAVVQVADSVWTGRQIKPAVSVKLGGKALALGKDYTVSYGANKDVGRGFVTVTGKGSFTGAKSVTFKILPKTIKLKAAKAGKKRAKVTWKKASKAQGITGYEIRYKDKKSKKWKVKKAKAKAKAITVKKLKKGKAYQFQIRAYKAVGGEVYASPWSKTKKSKKIK